MITLLPLTTITTAVTQTTTTPVFCTAGGPRAMSLHANFAYGSGGTNVTAYIQTSIDAGLTWCDIACFQVTTASKRLAFNLNSQTPNTTQLTVTDGAITVNTAQDGLLADRYRVKWASTGTYAGGTTLQIDASWSFA